MSSDKPTVEELDTCLRSVVKSWTSFALRLPGINQTELDIIEVNKPGDVVAQKLELYKVWLRVYPNASWHDVIKALEEVGENAIAEHLREKYLTVSTKTEEKPTTSSNEAVSLSSPPTSGAIPISPSLTTTVPEEVPVSEDVVTELDTLHQSFRGLECNVESGVEDNIENGDLTVKKVTRHLKGERAYSIPSLNSVTTSDELFDAIRPHCNFLHCYLIVSIALSFLSKAIAEKATKYKEKVSKFMKATKIRSLQNTLKAYSRIFHERSNTTKIEIVVENGWEEQELWLVENLISTLFPVKHPDELPWYDIVPGSVVMTFIALKHMTPSLIESSRKKTDFMKLIGVISLKIGDELVWKKESEGNKNSITFVDRLIQATLANNIEAVQFLLQYIRVNVNTKNTTNKLIYADDHGEIYWSQKKAELFVKSYHSTFTALLKDVKNEFQYVQGRMTAIDNDSNSSSSVADGDSKSTLQDNFLNARVLAGLSDQLPEPLSTRVKQYQATIDSAMKRKALLIHLSSSLVKYFPTPFPDSIEVILTLHSAWKACSVWYVEQLGQLIFTPTLFHKLQWFRVDTSKESLRVVLLADKELMLDSLTMECLGKNELALTPLLGVISVRVDDTVVIKNDNSDGYTFSEAMHLAKAIGNDEKFDLLLQIQQSPVDYIRFLEPDSNNNRQFLPEPDSTPLMIACCNDNSQLVQVLLDHNADPNIQTRRGYTALMYSTRNSKIFQMLLVRGADIKTCTFFNETMLHHACRSGNAKVVRTILASNPDLMHVASNDGYTLLIVACQSGHTAIVKILLKGIADPNVQTHDGWTGLNLASRNGHTEIVGMLLQAKADPNMQNNEGWTALKAASRYGYKEIVGMLLQAKADLNIQNNEGWTALNLASRNGHTEIVGMLLQAKADPNIQHNEGWTALKAASRYGHIEIVGMLLRAKADPNIQHNEGWTALQVASRYGHTEIVGMLLQAKADPNIQHNRGWTALKAASRYGHTEIVGMLLQAKADPNIQHNEGWTKSEAASRYGHTEVVSRFFQAKADPNIQHNEGWTALQLASCYGHTEIVKTLLHGKADPSLVDNDGLTALDLALKHNHHDIIKELCNVLFNE